MFFKKENTVFSCTPGITTPISGVFLPDKSYMRNKPGGKDTSLLLPFRNKRKSNLVYMKLYNFRKQSLHEQDRIACQHGSLLTSFSCHNKFIKLYYLHSYFVEVVRELHSGALKAVLSSNNFFNTKSYEWLVKRHSLSYSFFVRNGIRIIRESKSTQILIFLNFFSFIFA